MKKHNIAFLLLKGESLYENINEIMETIIWSLYHIRILNAPGFLDFKYA